MPKRKEKMLSLIDVRGRGLEIGASHSPIAPKVEGYNVEIIDHLPTEELRKKYSKENVSAIEEVDYVWSGESYSDLTGKKNYYDWVIASHVIEHVPDVVSFINDCSDILKEDGILLLAVPDCRLCFDQFRALSGLSEFIDAYHNKSKQPSPGDVIDYYLNISEKGGIGGWSLDKCRGQNKLVRTYKDALNIYKKQLQTGDYNDVHKWRFTPTSFKLLISDLLKLNYISMDYKDFYGPEGCEFVITLQKGKSKYDDNSYQNERLVMLETIQHELAEHYLRSKESRAVNKLRRVYKKFMKA